MAEAQLGIIGGLLNLIHIQGNVYCTANGNIGVNGTATPVFQNAGVQLKCGGNVVSTAKTNGAGIFSIVLDPLQYLLSTPVTNCSLEVKTPLASCDCRKLGRCCHLYCPLETLFLASSTSQTSFQQASNSSPEMEDDPNQHLITTSALYKWGRYAIKDFWSF
ncbi:hypothetical protein Pint_24498 [Pistacia integerrima]|uniref:Uncharacterized protein n=1 Tax=Pistacia integerrima TaxID=434235 RepID=A0ACC0YHR4_9ROSI|nr:hypothetical protein Pint_24498 [Pistacia integerrima]